MLVPFMASAKIKYMSGVYTIGGDKPHYKTIASAIVDLCNDSTEVLGRVTFNIRKGVYPEVLTITAFNGASPKNFVIFQAESGKASDVVIEASGGNTLYNPQVIRLEGCRYVTIQNLTIHNKRVISADTDYASGIHLTYSHKNFKPADYNTINRCTILLDSTYTINNATTIGIVSSEINNMYGTGNGANYNTISNNTIVGGYFGIKLYGTSTANRAKGNKVVGNKMSKVYNGIHIDLNDIAMVNNNTIFMRYDPLKIQYGIHLKNTTGNFTMSGNVIKDYGTFGIFLYNVVGGPKTYIYNNMIYGTCKKPYSRGIHIEVCSNLQFYYNSIKYSGRKGVDMAGMVIEGTGVSKISLKNNIFANPDSGGYAIIIKNKGSLDSCNYNDYYSSGTKFALFNNAEIGSITHFRDSTAKDKQSLNVNPDFSSDLHMRSQSLIRKANVLSFVLTDFEGHPRDPETPDIGADEVIKSDLDLEVFGLDKNFVPREGLNTLPVVIKNDGLLSLNGNTIKIQYQVNGGSWSAPESFVINGLGISYTKQVFSLAQQWSIPTAGSYQLTIRVNPAVPSDLNPTNDQITIDVCVGLSGTYTIGGATGPRNYAKFSDAVAAFGCGVGGATVFNVRSGTYNENLVVPVIKGASAENTVTFQAESGNAADVIVSNAGANTRANHHVIRVSGGDWVIFKNLTINNTGVGNFNSGIHLTNLAENVTIENCIINMTDVTTVTPKRYGILASAAEDIDVGGYNMSNLTVKNTTIKGGTSSIYVMGNGPTSRSAGLTVVNSHLDSAYLNGIYSRDVNIAMIAGNSVSLKSTASDQSYGLRLASSKSDGIVQRNKITRAGFRGIELEDVEGLTAVTIMNNMIGGGFKAAATGAGLYMTEVNKVNVYNNSIHFDKASATGSAFNLNSGANVNLLNNIFYNPAGGYAFYVSTKTALRSSDYNVLYTDANQAAGLFAYWGGDVMTLAALKTAMGGFEINSMEVDPAFTSTFDLHTTNVLFDGKAKLIPEVKHDFDGQTRNTLTPDIGADEFILTPVDLALLKVDPVVFDTDSNIIKVTLSNQGSLSLLGTPVTLSWSSNGGSTWSAPETFNPAAGTGLDTSYSSYVYTFVHKFKGVLNSTYDFWVRVNPTGFPGDGVSKNDTIKSVICVGLKAGTYTVGAGGNYPTLADAANAIVCGVTGPVVFNVLSGTYNERFTVNNPKNTSAVNTITFRSATGNANDVTITNGYTSPTQSHIIKLNRAKYINIENLTLVNTNTTIINGGSCIQLSSQSDHIKIRNNKLRMDQAADNPNLFVISSSDSANVATAGRGVSNLLVEGNEIVGGYTGISLLGNNALLRESNIELVNNDIRDSRTNGIVLNRVDVKRVHNNRILMRRGQTAGTGISISTVRNDFELTSNTVGYAASIGLSLSDVVSLNGSLVANNMIGGGFKIDNTGIGVSVALVNGMKFYNNSINYDGLNIAGTAMKIDAESRGIRLMNNSIANQGMGTVMLIDDLLALDTSDHNNLYTKGDNLAKIAGDDYLTIEEFCTATGTDEASITIEPDYFTPVDLRVSNTFLDGAAFPLPEVPVDIRNAVRSPTIPDIGAYEFSIAGNVKLLSIDSPLVGDVYPGAVPVIVTLKNIGNSKLAGLSIQYFVDGVSYAPEAIPEPLIPGDEYQYTFATSIVPPSSGVYRLRVEVALPDDTDPTDNYLETTFGSSVSEVVDGRLTRFITPTSQVSKVTPVVLEIENKGTVPMETFMLNYYVSDDPATVYSEAYNGDPIAPTKKDTYEFTVPIDASRLQRRIYAWIDDLTGDIDLSNDSISLFIVPFYGIGIDQHGANAFQVNKPWPNPANDHVNFKVNLPETGEVTIRVVDVLGKMIKEQKYKDLANGDNILDMDLSEATAGVYYTSVIYQDRVITHQLVISR